MIVGSDVVQLLITTEAKRNFAKLSEVDAIAPRIFAQTVFYLSFNLAYGPSAGKYPIFRGPRVP